MRTVIAFLSIVAALAGCPGSTETVETGEGEGNTTGSENETAARQSPPESGPARDIQFPSIARASVGTGLEVNTVEWHTLPIVYLQVIVKSGGSADPTDMPGMADLVGQMLKEGTRTRTSAQIAEEVEFLGADLWVSSGQDTITIGMRALSSQLDDAMRLLADVAMNPAFRPDEVEKLKRREIDRLALSLREPRFLANREFYRALYGTHPYAHVDTTAAVVQRVRRNDLARWHQTHFVANNAILVVAGDVTAQAVQDSATANFGRWRSGTVPALTFPEPPSRDAREIIVVNKPDLVQSVIAIGNLAVPRSSPDFVPLEVANQVLGGSAASRLFMDLRERRSLTYGAYSDLNESIQVAPFRASASVRTEKTAEAVGAFFEHLDRIVGEPAPQEEIQNAERYLSDSFPLRIDTPGKIGGLVGDLRVYGLPDDYWESYRSAVRVVTPAQAHAAARQYIHPDRALVVIVGNASVFVNDLRRFGAVTVLTPEGTEEARFEAAQ
jgi:zinc protease